MASPDEEEKATASRGEETATNEPSSTQQPATRPNSNEPQQQQQHEAEEEEEKDDGKEDAANTEEKAENDDAEENDANSDSGEQPEEEDKKRRPKKTKKKKPKVPKRSRGLAKEDLEKHLAVTRPATAPYMSSIVPLWRYEAMPRYEMELLEEERRAQRSQHHHNNHSPSSRQGKDDVVSVTSTAVSLAPGMDAEGHVPDDFWQSSLARVLQQESRHCAQAWSRTARMILQPAKDASFFTQLSEEAAAMQAQQKQLAGSQHGSSPAKKDKSDEPQSSHDTEDASPRSARTMRSVRSSSHKGGGGSPSRHSASGVGGGTIQSEHRLANGLQPIIPQPPKIYACSTDIDEQKYQASETALFKNFSKISGGGVGGGGSDAVSYLEGGGVNNNASSTSQRRTYDEMAKSIATRGATPKYNRQVQESTRVYEHGTSMRSALAKGVGRTEVVAKLQKAYAQPPPKPLPKPRPPQPTALPLRNKKIQLHPVRRWQGRGAAEKLLAGDEERDERLTLAQDDDDTQAGEAEERNTSNAEGKERREDEAKPSETKEEEEEEERKN